MKHTFGEQLKEKNRTGWDLHRGTSNRWAKKRTVRKMRRWAKLDPEGAPRKPAWRGWA